MSGLHNGSGAECPARPALALILDGVDGTLGSPVNVLAKIARIKNNWLDLGATDLEGTKHLLGFFLGLGREHVVAESEGVLLIVPLLNLVILLLKDLKSVHVLLFGAEAETLGADVSLESLMKLMNMLSLLMESEAEHGGSLRQMHHFFKVFILL